MHPSLKDKITKKECANCSSKESLELHHILPKEYGRSDEITNLEWLCAKCHKEKHSLGKVKKASVYMPWDLFVQYKEYELNRLLEDKPTNLNHTLISLLFKHLNQ